MRDVSVALLELIEESRPVAWDRVVRVSLAVDRMVDDKAKMAAWRSRSAALLTFRVSSGPLLIRARE